MSTLLSNPPLPLWAYIVIIVVGSLLVIGVGVVIIRCCIARRKSPETGHFDLQPERKVTLRRGRMVDASHYESLTGSRFGIGQFDEIDAAKSRSRSPFEWWNTILDRSQSRQDSSSQLDTTSIRATQSTPSLYGKREFAFSTHSLNEKERLEVVSTQEILPRHPSPLSERPTSHTNFSRSFVTRPPNSPLTIRSNTLSRIEEATSPHHSMISTISMTNRSSRISIIKPADGNLTRFDNKRSSDSSSRKSFHTASASPMSTNEHLARQDVLTVPRPIAYRGSRSSLGESVSRRDSAIRKSSNDDLVENPQSFTDISRRSSKNLKAGQELEDGYWNNREVSQPINRNPSKKGNVLRKKSLRRAEIVSMVDA